ncbi:hypothetical protein KZZ52_33535 [Dactylosporangium sp. AC04546]|uniref:hypothetical protein n=1 Tax=Dactylosporangium sp. AC04546 TaxID=2862460 RepID=UPI001EDCABEC|nr:hypothetical protein [Dactylosporangium sp. AC04546]WVK78900.1 hypothetical protein KZZ52_33535 [Dactylosporangium sp. AC04546]
MASPAAVADPIAMRDLARQRLLPQLPTGLVHAGVSFDGSRLLHAGRRLVKAFTAQA